MTNDNHSAILLMGASIIDIIVRPASPDVFETGSSPAEAIMMSVGADALNEATILAKMGKQVYLETVIGDDEAGRYIINHCKKNGIRISDEAVREEYATGINVVLVQENGERNFLTNKNGTLRKLRLEDIRMPFPECVKIVCFASIFVFPYIGVEELRIIFSQAKAQGKIVCADMTKCKNGETVEDMAAALSYVDYLFPNCEEALLLTGQKTVETADGKIESGRSRYCDYQSRESGLLYQKRSIQSVDSGNWKCNMYRYDRCRRQLCCGIYLCFIRGDGTSGMCTVCQ